MKTTLMLLGLTALLLVWCVLFFYFNLGSEFLMAPWEYDRSGIPELGTLSRSVNDFFDGIGSAVFATLLIATNVLILGVGLVQGKVSQTRTVWITALTNYVYLATIFVYWGLLTALYRVFEVSVPTTPKFDAFGVGYFLLLLSIYIVFQIVLARRFVGR